MSAVSASAAVEAEVAPPAAIESLILEAIDRAPFPGLSILIDQGGKVICRKGYGLADLENELPTRSGHVFPVGSITKTMASLCVLLLVEQGRIDIDAPAHLYLGDLPSDKHAIKVRHLLSHTSGLVNFTDVEQFPAESQTALSRAEMVAFFIDRPLDFAPGAQWRYSNSGLYLAGLIVEQVSGQTFDSYIAENVFRPFGMLSTSMSGWRALVRNRARGYLNHAGAGFQNASRYDPLAAFSAGGVMTTTDDLLTYRRALFGPAARVSAFVQDLLLFCDELSNGFVLPYTLGCLAARDFERHRKLSHSGDINGFAAHLSYYPDDDLTIAILTNVQGALTPPVSLEQKVARSVLGVPQPNIVDLPLSESAAAKFLGDFDVHDFIYGFTRLGIVFDQGRLAVRIGGVGAGAPALPLRWQGGEQFVSVLDDEQRVRFDPTGAGFSLDYFGGEFSLRRAAS